MLEGVLLFRTSEHLQATKVRMETGLCLFQETISIESLENHLLVAVPLLYVGWAVGNYRALKQTHGFLVSEHQTLPSLQKMKVLTSTGQEKFASVGVAALLQHFISFTQPPAELGSYCKKEQENKSSLQHLLICRSKFILCFSIAKSSE